MPSLRRLSRPGWHARSWTRSDNVKFWDEKVTRLLAETEHLLPCSPKELARALAEAGWPKGMVSNALGTLVVGAAPSNLVVQTHRLW